MTYARRTLVCLDDTPYYHCISRCVRRAFLWGRDELSGRDYSHRKQWVVDRLAALQKVFAIEFCAYAVMSNHYHVVLRVDRGRAQDWTVDEVIERWSRLFDIPPEVVKLRSAAPISEQQRARALDAVQTWRLRLYDVSWFMRCLNEHLARRANAEDQCKGRFWEGRFTSQALLDEAALLTCMSYVDLNPIRAGTALRPEEAPYTSLSVRVRSHVATPGERRKAHSRASLQATVPLLPFRSTINTADNILPFQLTDYIVLVDWTGRAIREGKPGYIPDNLPPILERLGIDPSQWLQHMQPRRNRFGRAVGRWQRLKTHARRIGQQWIKGIGLSQQLYPDPCL